jgi:insulysin
MSTFISNLMQGCLRIELCSAYILFQVAALKAVSKEDLLNFVAQNISRNSPNRRKLSIQVYGSQHLKEYHAAKGEPPSKKLTNDVQDQEAELTTELPNSDTKLNHMPTEEAADGIITEDAVITRSKASPKTTADRIDNIFSFKRSQQLYESLRGGKHEAYV